MTAGLTAYQRDVYRDILALCSAALDDDTGARDAILSAWQGHDGSPLLFAAIGRLLGLVAEHYGDAAGWIAIERAETFR